MKVYQAQIDAVAERDGVDAETARARVIDSMRLAATRREELGEGAELDPARSAHVREAALARVYLRDVFEAENGPEQVSDGFLSQHLALEQRAARFYHPKLHKLCQVLVRPKQSDDPEADVVKAPEDDAWWAEAEAMMAPIERRLRAWEADLEGEPNCDLIDRAILANRIDSEDGEMIARLETGVFEVDRTDLWTKPWVEALREVDEPGFVGPFRTEFGVHLVYILAVMPDTRVAPKEASEGEKFAKRSADFRVKQVEQWRAAEGLPNHIRTLRERHLVRLAGTGTGAVAGQPTPP